jgi:hypothetical protein
VATCPCRTNPTLNLGECPLHRGSRQIKVRRKLGEGCIGRCRTSAGNSRVESVRLQKVILQRRGAGVRLSHPGMHGTGEVRRFSIHTAIERATDLSSDAASLQFGYCGGSSEAAQQIDENISTLPHQ